MLFLPPFPVFLPRHEPTDPSGFESELSWAPIGQTRNGAHELSRWKDLAASGDLFDCNDESCSGIFHSFSNLEKGREEGLALCQIPRFGDVLGAPEHCDPVAIFGSDTAWIRILDGYNGISSPLQPRSLAPDEHTIRIIRMLRPSVDAVQQVAQSVDAVQQVAQKALAGPPLSLSTIMRTSSVVGTGSYRISPVLSGWREFVSVIINIELEFDHSGAITAIGVDISTSLYVNRQNTDRPEDWHMPSPQQDLTYFEAVRGNLKKLLAGLCKTHAWVDDQTLSCSSLAGH
jgi:hypothetical protein